MELTVWTYEGPPHVGAIRVDSLEIGLGRLNAAHEREFEIRFFIIGAGNGPAGKVSAGQIAVSARADIAWRPGDSLAGMRLFLRMSAKSRHSGQEKEAGKLPDHVMWDTALFCGAKLNKL